jgi:hypothetical protein
VFLAGRLSISLTTLPLLLGDCDGVVVEGDTARLEGWLAEALREALAGEELACRTAGRLARRGNGRPARHDLEG